MIKFNVVGMIDETLLGFDVKMVKKTIKRLTKVICQKEHVRGKHFISYLFVNNEEIHKLNNEYRHIDRPTDVISFAMIDGDDNDNQNEYPEELGDIFISYEKIVEQAKAYGHHNLREMAFLVTHGTLHLLGYDHQTPEDSKIMFDLQEEILNKVKITR